MRTETITCNNGKDSQLMTSFSEIVVISYDDVSLIETVINETLAKIALKGLKDANGEGI